VESALLAIVALACPLGMLLMGVVMWKGMPSKETAEAALDLDDLRAEHEKLGTEIERLESARQRAVPSRAGVPRD
jgi:hypothetical protein